MRNTPPITRTVLSRITMRKLSDRINSRSGREFEYVTPKIPIENTTYKIISKMGLTPFPSKTPSNTLLLDRKNQRIRIPIKVL